MQELSTLYHHQCHHLIRVTFAAADVDGAMSPYGTTSSAPSAAQLPRSASFDHSFDFTVYPSFSDSDATER